MRPTYTIVDIFEAPSRARILRALALTTAPMSIRAVSRVAGISHTAAGATLKDLESMGLVTCAAVGRATAYELRRSNAYVRHMVLPGIAAEDRVADEIRSDLVRMFAENCDSLILFGSYATGEQRDTSDIDVFALAPDERRKQLLDERAFREMGYFETTYGSPLSLLSYTRREAHENLRVGQSPFRTELESTGIILHGMGVSEWGDCGADKTHSGGAKRARKKAHRQGV